MVKKQAYQTLLSDMQARMTRGCQAFKCGDLVLIADDGHRENEVDVVFHAAAATPEKVNFVISHAKGLLCVSLSHTHADKLGFSTAPKFPGGLAHTNFTVSVDAKHGISTGISAADRSYTIALMADDKTTVHDFITPGHIYPLRAMDGNLLSRPGHTEALQELCLLNGISPAAALCEVLGEDGKPLHADFFASNKVDASVFANIPFISTVDILWFKVLFGAHSPAIFNVEKHFAQHVQAKRIPHKVLTFAPSYEESITLPTSICLYSDKLIPSKLRVAITNGIYTWDNGVTQNDCFGEIAMFSSGNCIEELPTTLSDFCDLSAKEGLKGTKISVRRMLSTFRALQELQKHFKVSLSVLSDLNNFITESDKDFITNLIKK